MSTHDDEADERAAGTWLEQLVRLQLGHAAGTISDARYQTETATARAGLATGTAVPLTGEDAAHVAVLAHAVLGDPIPGNPMEAELIRRQADLLRRIVQLKIRHETGELDDAQFHAEQARLGAEAEDAE